MGSVVALVVLLFGAYLVVTAGAVAYELTGMDRETARFQALSAFTNCGFTTTVTNQVVNHPLRRRITFFLIVLGWASAVTVIAALIETVDVQTITQWLLEFGSLFVIGGVTFLAFRIFSLDSVLLDFLRRHIMPRLTHEVVPHESLFNYKRGFGIVRIEVPPGSRCIGQTLRELHLPDHELQVLLVEAEDRSVAVPGPDEIIHEKAHLVLFGRMSRVEECFASGR